MNRKGKEMNDKKTKTRRRKRSRFSMLKDSMNSSGFKNPMSWSIGGF
jgi:hypothetical protein